jgi:hypothetical protein
MRRFHPHPIAQEAATRSDDRRFQAAGADVDCENPPGGRPLRARLFAGSCPAPGNQKP